MESEELKDKVEEILGRLRKMKKKYLSTGKSKEAGGMTSKLLDKVKED